MFYSSVLVAVTALSSLAAAQNYSTSGPLEIDTSQIPLALKQSWCRAQTNNCPDICGGSANPNTCDPNTLDYQCVCTDGSKPNISSYEQTVPFFVCQQWITNCVASHPDQLNAQTACQSVQCGTKNASTGDSDSSSSGGGAAASSAGASAAVTQSSSTASDNFAAATAVMQQYGGKILAGVGVAAFGLAL